MISKYEGMLLITSVFIFNRGETSAEVVIVKKTKKSTREENKIFAIKFHPLKDPTDLRDSGYRELRILLSLQKLSHSNKCRNFVECNYHLIFSILQISSEGMEQMQGTSSI